MSGPRPPIRRLTAALSAPARRVAVVGLALLVVLASSVAAVPVITNDQSPPKADAGAAAAPVVQVANTTSYLALPPESVASSSTAVVTVDPAASVAIRTARLHGRYETVRLREAFAAAETESARKTVVRNATQRVETRITRLEQRQAAALAAYNRGELSSQTLVRELVAVHAAARGLQSTIDQLYTFDRAAGLPVSRQAIAELKARLIPLQGPVRQRLAAGMTAGDRTRVHVTTSDSGLVLSTVARGDFSTRFIREALYGDGFDRTFADQPIDIETFEQRVAEQYPWTWANKGGTNSLLTGEPQYLRAGIYGIAVNHPHGTVGDRDLVVFYDADTEEVFYEVQRKDVTSVPTDLVASTVSDGVRVEVRATYPGGPMAVRVVNATSDTPVDATVVVDGDRVGQTGDGTLWTLTPSGPFVVTAETATGNVTVTSEVQVKKEG